MLTHVRARSPREARPATIERWFAAQGAPPRYDLARSGAAAMTVAQLLDTTGSSAEALLALSLDYGPGRGTARLADAVARSDGAPEFAKVVAAGGAVEALLLLCIATAGSGEVVVGAPAYGGLLAAPAAAGREVSSVPVWDGGGELDFSLLCARVTARTGLVVVNSPHNPSGARASLDGLDELAACCGRHGALLVVDEVARGTLDVAAPSAVHSRGFAEGVTVVIGDVSKSLGLGGLRVGWLSTADPALADAAASAKDGTTVAGCTLAEHLAAIALEHAPGLLERVRARAERNLSALRSLLRELGDGDGWTPPADGLVAFPTLSSRDGVDDLVERLRRRDVAVVPGSLFGEPGRARIGLGGASDDFAEGLRRIRDAIAMS